MTPAQLPCPCPVHFGSHWTDSLHSVSMPKRTVAKIKSRNNVIAKLAGTPWGASAQTLRSSAVALCYSVAEYCVPAWGRSPHVKTVDRQLSETMHIVSGTIRQTPLQWLPVLSHIAPPAVRRTEATNKFISYIPTNPQLPVYSDIFHHPAPRLKSSRPMWFTDTGSSSEEIWRESWEVNCPLNSYITDDATALVPGFDLSRREWCLLNRFHCDTGRCAASLHRWGYSVHQWRQAVYVTHPKRLSIVQSTSLKVVSQTLHTASDSAREWLQRRVHCIR